MFDASSLQPEAPEVGVRVSYLRAESMRRWKARASELCRNGIFRAASSVGVLSGLGRLGLDETVRFIASLGLLDPRCDALTTRARTSHLRISVVCRFV